MTHENRAKMIVGYSGDTLYRAMVGEFKIVAAMEREECAKVAWKMQMDQFGGGTAIGNAIMDRLRKEAQP